MGKGLPGRELKENGALDALEGLCRARGGRLTRQRRGVLSRLLAAGRPVTAYELLDLVRPEDPAATAAGIYRSLDFLIGMGLVHRLESTWAFVVCEHPDHPDAGQFLICRECGTVAETEDGGIDRVASALGQRHGFTLDHPAIELTGLCRACHPPA